MRLTEKEWRAIVQWFRSEEATLRDSYGEPHDKEGTFRKNYAEAQPTEARLYEAARQVIYDAPK